MKAKPSFVKREEIQVEIKESDFTEYTGMQTEFEKLTGIKDSESVKKSTFFYCLSVIFFTLFFYFIMIAPLQSEFNILFNTFLAGIFSIFFTSAVEAREAENGLIKFNSIQANIDKVNINDFYIMTVDDLPVPGEKEK